MPTYDPTGATAPFEWVLLEYGPLDLEGVLAQQMQGAIPTWHWTVDPAQLQEKARRVAIGHAARHLQARPDLFEAWYDAAENNIASSEATQTLIQGFGVLVDVGTPTQPAPDNALFGFVAESMTHELLRASDRGLGPPVHVEPHDWSTGDHGGDQLAIYEADGVLHFRLWESKSRRSDARTTKTVVKKAGEQLEERAMDYLARYSVTLSKSLRQPALANFVAHLPDLWIDGDPRGGAGVAVTTHTASDRATCFESLVDALSIADANKAGQLSLVTEYRVFVHAVRAHLWKGVGLG